MATQGGDCAECGEDFYNSKHLDGCSKEEDLEMCGLCETFYNGRLDSRIPMACECGASEE